MKDYVAFDLETTGLSPDSDQIIEIGAVKIRDGKISGKYNCIIHPEIEVSDFILIDTYIILYTNQLFASTLFSTIFLCFFMLRLT